MENQIIDVWCVWETTDERGRRGSLVAVCKTETNANAHAKGKGWYGGIADVQKSKAIEVFDRVYLLANDGVSVALDVDLVKRAKELKAQALAKLTKEEKTLLGLD